MFQRRPVVDLEPVHSDLSGIMGRLMAMDAKLDHIVSLLEDDKDGEEEEADP